LSRNGPLPFPLKSLSRETVAEKGDTVQLNFPTEIPIQTLADYVSQRLKINILYDQEIGNQKVNVKAATEIPVESLLGVLESALKISGLALIDSDVPGWMEIVKVENLSQVVPAMEPTDDIPDYGDATAATQAFVLKRSDPTEVEELIKPFLSQPGGNTVTVAQARTLIVTDYATNLVKIAKWIKFIDQPRVEVNVEFVPVKHQLAGELSVQLESILSAKSRMRGAGESRPRYRDCSG
jgi:general secretion pathway protein D